MTAQKLLHANIAQFFESFSQKHGGHMACREGCAACCHTAISVFASEAAEILAWFESQTKETREKLQAIWREPQKQGADALGKPRMPCSFLRNNSCTVYEARPTICRSQGLPLMFREHNPKTKETTLHIDHCPLNFTGENTLPPQAEWLDLDRLNTLQSLAAGQPVSVSEKLKPLMNKDARIALQHVTDFLLTL
jgi:Fe-S-cluster containining protein